ncbi:MAG: hypothetical protein WD335_00780 [Candidatus Paceibacterota bacterium]
MPGNFTQKKEQPQTLNNNADVNDAALTIKEQMIEAQKESNGNGSLGDHVDIDEVGELNKSGKKTNKLDKKQEEKNEGDERLPKRPTKNGQSSNTVEKSESKPAASSEQPTEKAPPAPYSENETEKKVDFSEEKNDSSDTNSEEGSSEITIESQRKPKLEKIISAGDPVLLYGIKDFDTPGAWFYTGESIMVKEGSQQKSKVEIIYKYPDGSEGEKREVSWSEITPIYESAEEYTQALQKIRDIYEKAVAEKNTDYQEHLAHLLKQVNYFAIEILRKAKEEYGAHSESDQDQLDKTAA